MIPEGIGRDHILEALASIDSTSIPANRQSADYELVYDGKRYPPKFVVSKAAELATGSPLKSSEFSGGAETNAFLSSLGFRVEGLKKPGRVGPDADIEGARAVFERLIPDEGTRRKAIEIFADVIEVANQRGAARWQISLQRDLVRLNAGRALAFDIRPQDAFVGIDAQLVDEATRAKLEAYAAVEKFAVLPHLTLYRPTHGVLVDLWPSIRSAVESSVSDAALTARRCVWSRLHSYATVEYLADVLSRAVPQPDYGEESEALDDLRRVYMMLEAPPGASVQSTPTQPIAPASGVQVEDGDIVLHLVGRSVSAVSRVRSTAQASTSSEPIQLETWRVPESVALPDTVPDSVIGTTLGVLIGSSEETLSLVVSAAEQPELWPAWARPVQSRSWMLHAAPDVYDVRAAVAARPELSWRIRQHRDEIHAGDTAYLWESGPDGGIVATAHILTDAAEAPLDEAEKQFVLDPTTRDDVEVVVRLRVERVLSPIISSDELRGDPFLSALTALKSPQRTNTPMSGAQAALLERAATGARPPRVVKIAPGDKGDQWEACLAGGYICVGWDKVGDLRKFANWAEFRNAFAATGEAGQTQPHITIKAQELWTLRQLRPGDKVVANRGLSRILGVGTVKEPGYSWDEGRASYKHVVAVDWDDSVARQIPPHRHWGMTTVGKVPPELLAMVLPDLAGDAGPTEPRARAARKVSAASIPPPATVTPFASLVASLQSKETRLWFSDETIAHYVLALQAKRFVILTGVSGTGKTQLALAVAKHFQPRVRRPRPVDVPDGAVVRRVMPYNHQYRRMTLPSEIAAGIHLHGLQGNGSHPVDLVYPGGEIAAAVYRDVRSPTYSVHQLSMKGPLAEWLRSVPVGDEIQIELLDTGPSGRDRIRISRPVRQEDELVVAKNYEVVAVRPDWTDARGLLGFHNALTGQYTTTPFLRLLLAADEELRNASPGKSAAPFFVILDEMNLARVEQYFSDFLSSLESGEPISLHDDPKLETGESDGDDLGTPVPRSIRVPSNLFFIGTVNVDETTSMFSPKVLDRAFVIEFNEVDLVGYGMREDDDSDDSPLELTKWTGFEPYRPVSADDWDALAKIQGGEIREKLTEIHDILSAENRHFGYRVANEVGRFITLAQSECSDPDDGVWTALDLAVLSKVLPKLHGTQQELEPTLVRLLRLTLGADRASNHADWHVESGQLVAKSAADAQSEPEMPRSSLKLWRMLRRLQSQGFTSFIE